MLPDPRDVHPCGRVPWTAEEHHACVRGQTLADPQRLVDAVLLPAPPRLVFAEHEAHPSLVRQRADALAPAFLDLADTLFSPPRLPDLLPRAGVHHDHRAVVVLV